MIQRQLGLIPFIVRKEDKGEYIQSLIDSRENDDSTIAQDTMLRHHIANLNRRISQYQENDGVNVHNDGLNDGVKLLKKPYKEFITKSSISLRSELLSSWKFSISLNQLLPERPENIKIRLYKKNGVR